MKPFDVSTVDLKLLLKQKQALLRAIERQEQSAIVKQEEDAELLEGVLNLLDYIHDTIDPTPLIRRFHETGT